MSSSGYILPKSASCLLKCTKCSLYLSIPPITVDSGGYQCGRCYSPTDTSQIRAMAYESLAKFTKFPCIYDSLGCPKNLEFGELVNHEEICEFQTHPCPLVSDCKAQIRLNSILQHCQGAHPNSFINSSIFHFPQLTDDLTKKIIVLNSNPYLLQFRPSLCGKKWGVCLKYFENKTNKEIFYQLEIRSEHCQVALLDKQIIEEYKPGRHDNDFVYFDREAIKSVLQTVTFDMEIKLVTNGNSNKNERKEENSKTMGDKKLDWLLRELECIVCNELMAPPIYSCTRGHSLCSNCRSQIEKCPSCLATYEGARNFTLEKLTEHLEYPCKNQSFGCPFVGTPQNIRDHESKCPVKIIACPLRSEVECDFKGVLLKLIAHLEVCHRDSLDFTLDCKRILYLDGSPMNGTYCVVFQKNLFRIFVTNNESGAVWIVKHVGLGVKDKGAFLFVLTIFDQSDMGRVLKYSGPCGRDRDDPLSTLVEIDDKTLRNFVQNGELLYSIDLKEAGL